MKHDLVNELFTMSQQIYAVGSLIGANSDTDSDPTETNNGIFLILAEISRKLKTISEDLDTEAAAMRRPKTDMMSALSGSRLELVKEVHVS